MLTISAILVALPAVTAHDPPQTIPTYAYVSCSPRTVGVGQYTLIVFWLDKYPPTAGGLGGDLWRGWMLDITKPDGSTQQIGPITSSQIGSAWVQYVPDQTGTYTIVFSWPGQTLGRGVEPPNESGVPWVGDFFEGATSAPFYLEVTTEPTQTWEEPPLPDYWTRPISSANRNWAQLASNWLGGSWLVSDWQRVGQGPNTGHILWTRQVIDGGIPDASYGANHGQTTDYENFFGDPIIMNGKIYYNTGMYPEYGYYCIDLQTGEELWYKNGTDNGLGQLVYYDDKGGGGARGPELAQGFRLPSFGQMFHYYSLNGAGVLSHLWITDGSTWHMLDANTGNWVMTITNVPGGTTITDQMGSILRYTYDDDTGQFLAWNVTQSIGPPSPTGTGQQQWEPRIGGTIDAQNDSSWWEWGPDYTTSQTGWDWDDILPRSGFTMNVTGPAGLPGSIRVLQDENRVPRIILGSSFSSTRFGTTDLPQEFTVWAVRIDENVVPYSPAPDKTWTQNNNLGYGVTLLYEKTIPYPLGGDRIFSLGAASYEDGVFVIECKESIQKWGYDLMTGDLLWGPTAPEDSWNVYGQSNNVAYGNLYGVGYGGKMYCYDLQTGQLKWTYEANGIGYESPYGDYPLNIGAIADGKVYLYSTEHSPTTPLWRGSYLRCVDAYTGEELWKVLNFVDGMSLADGKIVAGDWYDQRMYCYGKGPSATTVTGPETVVPLGTSVLIKGTVTDQSAGAKELAQSIGFPTWPTGVPAIADEYMDVWMEYLYKQQICPGDAKGVDVTLNAIDPNGNSIPIGTATSNIDGTYALLWTPDIEGKYEITATFEGTQSYGSSFDTTYIGVGPATSAGTPIEPEPTEPTAETPIITTEVAIIAAIAVIAVIGIVAFWALKRRK
jgi:outer membrane protein assembly factor BamB